MAKSDVLSNATVHASINWDGIKRKAGRILSAGGLILSGVLTEGETVKVQGKVQQTKIEAQRRKEEQEQEARRRKKDEEAGRGDGGNSDP